jgi:hypothetical protein
MARTKGGVTQKTKKEPNDIQAVGIGLKVYEWERFTEIAEELGMNRHKLAMKIMRDWLEKWERGEIPIETKTIIRKTLKDE